MLGGSLVAVILGAAAALSSPAAATDYSPSPGSLLWMQTWHPRRDFMKYGTIEVVNGPGGDVWLGVSGSKSAMDGAYIKRACVGRYTAGGAKRWAKVLPDTTDMVWLNAIAVDRWGNAVVAAKRDVWNATHGYAWTIVKLSPSGQKAWSKQIWSSGPPGNGSARDVAVDASGNIYIAGTLTRKDTGDDIALVKLSPSGATRWTRYIDGYEGSADSGAAVAVDAKGRVFVAGTAGGVFTGTDIVIARYTSAGKQVWKKTWDGDGRDDAALDIAVGAAGVAISGSAKGVDGRLRGVVLKAALAMGDADVPTETIIAVPGYDFSWVSVATNAAGDVVAGGTAGGGGASRSCTLVWRAGGSVTTGFWDSGGNGASCSDVALTSGATLYAAGWAYTTPSGSPDVNVWSIPSGGGGWETMPGLPGYEVGESVAVTPSGVYVAGESGDQIGLWKFQP